MLAGLVAHIPAPDGADAVSAFLQPLRDASGALPSGLKGGRVVFLGKDPEACLDPEFEAGLRVMASEGLSWDFCCHSPALPAFASASRTPLSGQPKPPALRCQRWV